MAAQPRTGAEDEWLTTAQVAAELQVHPATVRAWANDGSLPGSREGKRKWRFRRSAVREFVRTYRGDADDPVVPFTAEIHPGISNTSEDVF